MKYVVTNCTCINDNYYNSEPMEYEQALELYSAITRQAKRGLREFPDLLDDNGNIIM